MPKKRVDIPKSIRDGVLREFNHRCAICGTDNPQVHHIDENPSNNEPLNLLPLCPNCHLVDQHNPTATIDPEKLRLFRMYKDPTILAPEFDPLFQRLGFFRQADNHSTNYDSLVAQAEELIDFVSALEMGSFYAKRIKELLPESHGLLFWTPDMPDHVIKERYKEMDAEYCGTLSAARDEVYRLSIEMLRYQRWASHGPALRKRS